MIFKLGRLCALWSLGGGELYLYLLNLYLYCYLYLLNLYLYRYLYLLNLYLFCHLYLLNQILKRSSNWEDCVHCGARWGRALSLAFNSLSLSVSLSFKSLSIS